MRADTHGSQRRASSLLLYHVLFSSPGAESLTDQETAAGKPTVHKMTPLLPAKPALTPFLSLKQKSGFGTWMTVEGVWPNTSGQGGNSKASRVADLHREHKLTSSESGVSQPINREDSWRISCFVVLLLHSNRFSLCSPGWPLACSFPASTF